MADWYTRRKWLLSNTKWAIFQIYYGGRKLHSRRW